MVANPNIDPNGVYGITLAARTLGISRDTLKRYEETGRIRLHARKNSTGRLVRAYKGKDLLKLWNTL